MNEASDLPLRKLIEALRATKKDICVTAANRLDNLQKAPSEFDLHLRQANLNEADAISIAAALNNLSLTSGPSLRSFSISYNPGVRESGVIALITALPQTIREIGMVGCNLGDDSGQALLDRVRQTASLRMLCVEENNFSVNMLHSFADLRKQRNGFIVVV